MIDLTLDYARSRKGDSKDDIQARQTTADLTAEFEADPDASTKLNPNLFTGEVRQSLSLFWPTGVAYNFTLDMTEMNNADGELSIGSLFGRRAFGIGMKAGMDLSRENTRTFTVTDNFADLVKRLTGCKKRIVGPNYIYPMAGRIGVDDMIRDFVYMTIFGNLTAENTSVGAAPKGPPTLVDSLVFTTTISGSVNPTVVFAPAVRELGVTAAGVDLAASRIDKHQVVVGLALASAGHVQLGAIRDAYFGAYSAAPGSFVAPLLTASPATRSETVAATAVNQFLTERLFSPTINLPP